MQENVENPGPAKVRPFVPSEEWIEAFERQMAPKDFEVKLHRYARTRGNLVAHAGGRVDDLYARELVQDALGDTLDGKIAWDPAVVTLERHMFDAIKSRTRHDYIKAQRRPHFSFDADAPPALSAEVEASLATQTNAASAEVSSAMRRVLAELRRLAARDADVLSMLDAYEREATKKVDVMQMSGLTAKKYEAARKRMHRLVLQLPTDVRDPVRA